MNLWTMLVLRDDWHCYSVTHLKIWFGFVTVNQGYKAKLKQLKIKNKDTNNYHYPYQRTAKASDNKHYTSNINAFHNKMCSSLYLSNLIWLLPSEAKRGKV